MAENNLITEPDNWLIYGYASASIEYMFFFQIGEMQQVASFSTWPVNLDASKKFLNEKKKENRKTKKHNDG